MDTQIRSAQPGAIRVSDAERDQAVAELSEHYQAGRLTLEEFDERSNLALGAKTGNDLVALFADLPTKVVPAAMRPAEPARPAIPTDFGGHPFGYQRASGAPIARLVIACVLAAIIFGNVNLAFGHHHHFGWLVPLVVLTAIFLRVIRRR
jgi:hypothetical protein